MQKMRTMLTLTLVLTVVTLGLESAESASENDSRIVGGFPATANKTMHQVSIRQRQSDQISFGSGHICGGSLITNRTILTAAHCLVDSNNRKRAASYFRVVGGTVNRTQASETTEIRDVSNVIIHPRYNPNTFDNDVGILTLSQPIASGHRTVRPIDMAFTRPPAGAQCQTSGWGTTEYGTSGATVQLMAVNISVIPTELCNSSLGYNGIIRPGMFCVGEWQGGRDACQGDSGGPLVCNGILAGVVSHGYRCAVASRPGVYADVAYYREWILKNGAGRNKGVSVTLAIVTFSYYISRLVFQHK
ncbi:trypsin beta-like [Toxorhynchites rutilus septentrionalis]|uniref:trypsin beta-like n=1 Tax=Toxorhynchites rutilus septentrionalis TaxID=329112 RepID=UPI00247AA778|nr:trypsin beta-like [Toxorhynchites rutilus septentrionalis]